MATAKTKTNLVYGNPAFQRAAELSRRFAEYEAAAGTAQAGLDNLKERRAALAARLAELDARRPVIGDGIDPSLVDALVADPSAQPDPASIATRADDHIATMTRWEADKEVVTQAIGRIDADIEAAEAALNARSGPGGEAFREFVETAHEALLATFLSEFQRLKEAYIAPMRLLEAVDQHCCIGSTCAGSNLIIRAGHRRLDEDSSIDTVSHGASGRSVDKHLNLGRLNSKEARESAEKQIQAFRQALEQHDG